MIKINKKILVIVIPFVFFLLAGFVALNILSDDSTNSKTGQTIKTASGDLINVDPPTKNDTAEVDKNKDSLSVEMKRTEPKSGEPGQSNIVTPTISYAGQYDQNVEVSAFISGILEDGGVCTLVMEKNSNVIERKVTAFKNATFTSCTKFSINSSEFDSGTWTAYVNYESAAHKGVSAKREIVIK